MRLHIGQISPALATDIGDLELRLEKYGELLSGIDLHKKEHGEWYFGFVNINLSDSQFQKLRNALAGVLFKKSRLKIDKAKEQPLPPVERHSKPELNRDQMKRLMSHKASLNGRRRESKRSDLANASFRVIINGRVHKPSLRKQKLWGIDRRPLQRLAFEYRDGCWVNGEGQIIEVVAQSEQDRNARLLENIQTGYLSDSDFEEFQSSKRTLLPQEEPDSDLEIIPKHALQEDKRENDEAFDSDEDESHQDQAEESKQKQVPVNQSEVLRDAFKPESTPFTLFYDAETLPDAEPAEPAEAPRPPQQRKLGLFWNYESPLLRSQSQALKFHGDFDPDAWHARFYEKRGDYNRYLKRRRRDFLKKQRKMHSR